MGAPGDEGRTEEGRDRVRVRTARQLHDGTQVDGQATSGDAMYHS